MVAGSIRSLLHGQSRSASTSNDPRRHARSRLAGATPAVTVVPRNRGASRDRHTSTDARRARTTACHSCAHCTVHTRDELVDRVGPLPKGWSGRRTSSCYSAACGRLHCSRHPTANLQRRRRDGGHIGSVLRRDRRLGLIRLLRERDDFVGAVRVAQLVQQRADPRRVEELLTVRGKRRDELDILIA